MASEAVVPNSTVWLMSGVPLDNTYRHSLYFATEADQRSTFLSTTSPSWIIQKFEHQMYKRVNKGTLRVAIHAEYLYQCNYMAFVNHNVNTLKYPYGKMFYAFVIEVNYISEKVTEIKYELDYIQSYMFEVELAQCTVEREHTYTDKRYEHTVPENLGLGEFQLEQIAEPRVTYSDDTTGGMFSHMGWFVVATCYPTQTAGLTIYDANQLAYETPETPPAYSVVKASAYTFGGMLCGTYTQAFYLVDENDTLQKMLWRLQYYLKTIDKRGFSDGVVNIFCAPMAFWEAYAESESVSNGFVSYLEHIDEPANVYKRPFLVDVPVVNNKCYSFPYNYVMVSSSDGDSTTYKYELSTASHNDKRAIALDVIGSVNSDAEFLVRPRNYRTISGADNEDVVRVTKTPMCSWNSDTFKCWLAQHKMGMLAGAATTLIGAASGMAMAGINVAAGIGAVPQAIAAKAGVMAGADVLNYTTKMLGEFGDAAAQPNQARGNITGIIETVTRTFGFRFYRCTIKPEYMAAIDDYFTKYGYAVKRLKKPSIHNRLRYTYVKTVDAEIMPRSPYTETCPGDVNDAITSIYNNGITFWVNWNEVGNYSVTNTPLGDIPAQSQSA